MLLDHTDPQPDKREPQITKKTDGYMMTFWDSTSRYMTWFETLLYKMFNWEPEEFRESKARYALWHAWKYKKIMDSTELSGGR